MHELLELLGGVYGWCWIERLERRTRIRNENNIVVTYFELWAVREYSWCFLYWPAEEKRPCRWILSRRPIIILAGYMSRNRGLHWDRKRR